MPFSIEITSSPDKFRYMALTRKTVVAIPVRNEENHLTDCLDALASQIVRPDAIILLLNNCSDGSLDICRRASRSWPAISVVECHLSRDEASAGEARRRAIEQALAISGDGVILTTDADTIVPPGWIADNLGEIDRGTDCVCGVAIVRQQECDVNIPRLEFDEMREAFLLNIQDEIASIVDPDPADPWPRHQQHSGASIAVRAGHLRKIGGAPRIASGEDRALVARLALVDSRIRHAPHIQVAVSGRLHGRAAGGMAETLRRRLHRPDHLTDENLEPTVDAYRRVLARARLRAAGRGDAGINDLATDLIMNPLAVIDALHNPFFGLAWASIQRQSPVLQRRRVAFADLARETRQALTLRDHLRGVAAQRPLIPAGAGLRHAI